MVWTMPYVLSYNIFLSKSLISKYFLIVFLIVFLGLPLVIWLLFTWSTLLIIEFTGLLSTCPKHLSLVSTIFSSIGATPILSLMFVISDSISSSLTTHSSQHSYLYYISLFSCWCLTAQHFVPYNSCSINFSFNLSRTFVSHKTLEALSISATQLEFNKLQLILFLRHFVLWTQMTIKIAH